jgi:hypothetical protein
MLPISQVVNIYFYEFPAAIVMRFLTIIDNLLLKHNHRRGRLALQTAMFFEYVEKTR